MKLKKENSRYCKTPIGVFDSGVGGLSVLKELQKLLPDEHYIYYGDTKNLPYGDKTAEEIINFGKNTLEFFKKRGVKNVVMACNTSSALAYDKMSEWVKNEVFDSRANEAKRRSPYDAPQKESGNVSGGAGIKIYPIIQSVAKNLAEYNKIGIMATVGTANSLKYTKEILKNNPCAEVYELGCENFVKIVENKLYNDSESIKHIREKLDALLKARVEKIVLGCTHYPYLLPILTKYAPKAMFINPSIIFAQNIANEIKAASAPYKGRRKKEFYVSASPEKFKENAKMFYGKISEKIKMIDFDL